MSEKKASSAAAAAAAAAATQQAKAIVENIEEDEEARLWEDCIVSGSRALPTDIGLSESPAAIMAEDEAVFRCATVVSSCAGSSGAEGKERRDGGEVGARRLEPTRS